MATKWILKWHDSARIWIVTYGEFGVVAPCGAVAMPLSGDRSAEALRHPKTTPPKNCVTQICCTNNFAHLKEIYACPKPLLTQTAFLCVSVILR
jgi:hypothetical protein